MEAVLVAEAYEAHRIKLEAYVTSLTRNREDALDVVQEAYVRLAEQVRVGRAPDKVDAWLFRVGRNLAMSHGRRQQLSIRVTPRLRDDRTAVSAEDTCLAAEVCQKLATALATVTSTDRAALVMAATGYSGQEIAAALRLSHGAVRVRQCRARARLRGQLADMD